MDLPSIAKADYEAFQEIMGSNLTHTFNGWLDLTAKWSEFYGINNVRNIRVFPDKFAEHIRSTGRVASMRELLAFAEIIAQRQ